jgi:hypothetical protein
MKTLRSLMVLAGLSVAILAMSAVGAKAQLISLPDFTGSFTLPVQARWGGMTLPAGDYSLYYGQPFKGGIHAVEVVNKADGWVLGMAFVRGLSQTSASKNELVCTREGNTDIIRALDVPALGESIHFDLPHNMKLMTNGQNHPVIPRMAEARGLTQRIPVSLNRE